LNDVIDASCRAFPNLDQISLARGETPDLDLVIPPIIISFKDTSYCKDPIAIEMKTRKTYMTVQELKNFYTLG